MNTVERPARTRRRARLGVAAAAMLVVAGWTAALAVPTDNPEPGRQGEILPGEARVLPKPYAKGVEVIGHAPIGGRAGNIQLAWIDHCAYVSSGIPQIVGPRSDPAKSGVAVIDVSDPRAPRQVGMLRDAGALNTTETIHAVSAPGRKVLVAGAYAGGNAMFGPHDPPLLDIYDASDCAHPRLMAEYTWPTNAHTVTISADGRHVYGTHQEGMSGHGGLLVLDISDLSHPHFLGQFGVTGPDGRRWEFAPHEISISPDERRIYAGVTDSTGDDLNPGLKKGFSPERMAPDTGGIYILDSSDFADGKPDPQLRLVGAARHGGWHSVAPANIGGVPYLVGGGELTPCPGAVPKIVNIADETHPFIESEFRLTMNRAENCRHDPPSATGTITMGAPSATLHYNDVDDAKHTRLGLFNFTVAGLRIADLRDPKHPVEVAYFRPGDMCTGHVRYLPKTGEIWSVCEASGFWVTRLTPEVRAAVTHGKH